jgi:hypothetical protein
MRFPVQTLRQRLLTRYQEAVDAGLLAWAGLVGSEADAARMPKMPGAAILLQRGGLSLPHGVGGPVRQVGIVEWTVYAGGQDQKATGRAGAAGPRGGDYALEMVMQIGDGFLMRESDAEDGFPLWIDSFDLAGFDQPAGKFVYEVALRHEWNFVEEGFEDD